MTSTAQIVVNQGRVADRTEGMIRGAQLLSAALAQTHGLPRTVVGTPGPALDDDWSQALPAARQTLAALRTEAERVVAAGDRLVSVANTCSASLATVPVAASREPEALVLWIDAHGDFNTPDTTGSGYLGGMVLAACAGLWDAGQLDLGPAGSGALLDPRRVLVVGGRDLDPAEEALLRESGARVLSPADSTPERLLAAVGDAPVWVHVDWDVLEPGSVPAGYAVPGGLSPEQVRALLSALVSGPQGQNRVRGVELAEFAATGDQEADDRTVALLLEVLAPLFTD